MARKKTDDQPQEKPAQWRDPEYLTEGIKLIEGFDKEIDNLREEIKTTYEDLELHGFDKKALKEIIRRRKKDRDEVEKVDEEVTELEGWLLI